MKKLLHILLSLFLLNTAGAQPFSLNLQPLQNVSFQQPAFVGKTGSQYAIIDMPDTSGASLYLFSPTLQLVKKTKLPQAAFFGFRFSRENAAGISWIAKQNDSVFLNRLLLQPDGDLQPVQSIALPNLAGVPNLLANKTGSAYFYYTLQHDGKNHMLIQGSLVNDALQIVENIDGTIDFDPGLERFTGPALDANGNIQLVIYDKLSNYHESASIRVNTIPYARKEILEEIFHFEKVKLYDLLLFDNEETKQLQLTGFFYNGTSKTINGIASIRFPYERVNQITHSFSRFTEEQRSYLAMGMEHVRKHDDVFDFLKLRGIYRDGQNVLLGAWMLDMPIKKIVKDREYEEHQNTSQASWIRNGSGLPVGGNAVSRMPSNQGSMVPLAGTNYYINYSNWDNSSLYRLYRQPLPVYDRFQVLQRSTDRRLIGKNQFSFPMVRPKKFVFFSVNPDGKFEWVQAVPGDLPLQGISADNLLQGHFFFDQDQWRLPFYDAQQATEKKAAPMFSLNLATISRTGMQKEALLQAKPEQYYFSGLWKLNDTQYVSAYTDSGTGQSGFATLSLVPKDTVKQ